MMNEESYESDVIRYKKKYRLFRNGISTSVIKKALVELGYTDFDSVKSMLKTSNSKELSDLVIKIALLTPHGRGNISSIMYSSVVSELLDCCEIDFEIHVGFVLPVKVKDVSKYKDCYLVNYMYIKTDSVAFHYLNGVLEDNNFTFIRDNLVEV